MTEVKRIKADELTPDIRNANRGTERGRYALETSLREYGAGRSIVIDKAGRIIAGNKTLETAAEMGLDDVLVVQTDGRQIVAVQRMDLDLAQDDKARMLAYADNRVGQLDLDFDPAVIAEDIAAGLDLDLFWQDFELDEILETLQPEPTPGEDTEPEIDKAEELRQKWGVETGQLWQLGDHRLICGDCTDAEVVAQVGIENKMPLFTDPPYGINYDPKWLDGVGTHRQALSSRNTIVNDDGSLDLSFLSMHEKRMVWGFPYIYDQSATGWIVWDKQPGVDVRGIVTPIEMAYTTMRKGFDMVRVMWGGYYRAKGEDSQPHPTQKPIGVYQPFIDTWTKPNEEIADYFCGSAPTIIACENLKRRCRAVEISPGYVAVALERWHQHTGKMPELIES